MIIKLWIRKILKLQILILLGRLEKLLRFWRYREKINFDDLGNFLSVRDGVILWLWKMIQI